jgi:hypothetical protein
MVGRWWGYYRASGLWARLFLVKKCVVGIVDVVGVAVMMVE